MSRHDAHNIRARLDKAYEPIFKILKKLEVQAEETLHEFGVNDLDLDTLSVFVSGLNELENLYVELLELLGDTIQDLTYESKTANEVLRDLKSIRSYFENIRIRLENLRGFMKPNVDIKSNELFKQMLKELNTDIAKLRDALSIKIREQIDDLRKRQLQYEELLDDADLQP